MKMTIELFSAARACLEESDLEKKLQLSVDTTKGCQQGFVLSDKSDDHKLQVGRPEKPKLVPPLALPRRGFGTVQGRLSLLHAIAHIEFNAINLAWDAIYRFQDMPEDYYRDWLQVAEEEIKHFMLLRKHLNEAASDYGDFDAHDGLWTMAENTANDVLHRMAIIPRVLEARGLDVTPAMIKKFANIGETHIVETLEIIYKEEIGHVRIGNKWFCYVCEQRGLEPENTFINLVRHYKLDEFRGAINKVARSQAGFSEQELDFLESEFVKV
jgi:uncharacterized ferritin-like protein (DUF455 family)